jgi:hypothetical protein
MSIYKTTNHILSKPYEKLPDNLDLRFGHYRNNSNLSLESPPTIYDISLWEQIYYEPGFIGVYAAYDPYVEFYMITYNFFIDKAKGIETFFGADAVDKVIDKTKKLGVDLKIYTINCTS